MKLKKKCWGLPCDTVPQSRSRAGSEADCRTCRADRTGYQQLKYGCDNCEDRRPRKFVIEQP